MNTSVATMERGESRDTPIEQHQQHRRHSDQAAADQRGYRVERRHGCLLAGSIPATLSARSPDQHGRPCRIFLLRCAKMRERRSVENFVSAGNGKTKLTVAL